MIWYLDPSVQMYQDNISHITHCMVLWHQFVKFRSRATHVSSKTIRGERREISC